MIIYKTTNLVNKKFYIGKQVGNRKSYLGSGKLLKKAIKKYGKQNFKKEVLESCSTLDELNEKEIYWIKKMNAIEEGYNITEGGTGGDTRSNGGSSNPGFKKGHSTWNKGVPMRDETKKKLSKILKGKSPNSTTFKAGEKHIMYGTKQSKKTIQKRIQTGRENNSWNGNPTKCVNIKDGKVFNSLKEAASYYSISYDVVKYSCKKHTNDFRYYEK